MALTPHNIDGLDRPTMAVFDFGKTNAKMLIFSDTGDVVASARSTPRWVEKKGRRHLDEAHLWAWMETSLAEAARDYDTDRIMVTTHGCTFAMIADNHLVLPILDYEGAIPKGVCTAFSEVAPNFSETGSPDLPNGLNYGIQIFWMSQAEPEAFASVKSILTYPQFWTWRLAGEAHSEVSYLGCHSHLWSPYSGDYSSLVDQMGWREKMAPLKRAGLAVGSYTVTFDDGSQRALTVHNGVHDSNASLSFYTTLGYRSFTLVSTGTWVVVFNTDAPFSIMDKSRDMLANVTVDGLPIVSARFMGGREFDVISEASRIAVTAEDVATAVRMQQMALPSFAAGGPFPGLTGQLVGPKSLDSRERAAVATLYLACMTALTLEHVGSENPVIIDGGLSNNPLYGPLVAALRPGQTVLLNAKAEGTAAGAAALAFASFTTPPFSDPCQPCVPLAIDGLDSYFAQWLALCRKRDKADSGQAHAT